MTSPSAPGRRTVFGVSAFVAALVATGSGHSFSTGIFNITSTFARVQPACQLCHSAPINQPATPRVSLVPSDLLPAVGSGISGLISSTGGIAGTVGGFTLEATSGTLLPGSNSRTSGNGQFATHVLSTNSNNRMWDFSFIAPAVPGLVKWWGVVNTVNGDGTNSNDLHGLHGFDSNANDNTPVRLYALGAGVQSAGAGCPDGFGNQSVLGSPDSPTIGNTNFRLELFGASPGAVAILVLAVNSPGFMSLDLGAAGLPGCFLHLENPLTTGVTVTSGSAPGREPLSEGSAVFTLSLPSDPVFTGRSIQAQTAFQDPSAGMIGRSVPLSLSNALEITLQ